jgi:hypothetical protein
MRATVMYEAGKNNSTLTPALRIVRLIALLCYLSGLALPAHSNATEGMATSLQQ